VAPKANNFKWEGLFDQVKAGYLSGDWGAESTPTGVQTAGTSGGGGANEKIAGESNNTKFTYNNNPMDNPKAAQDIIEDPDAVYGFSPNPESKSIGGYADAIDWKNPDEVAKATVRRETYHSNNDNINEIVNQMREEGHSSEQIARAANEQRNLNRLNDYIDDPEGMTRLLARNESKYGSANGPTAEFLYDKYGSWDTMIEKSMSANPGMDACCGLYDKYYHLYQVND
jgi:hypothetical protein